MTAILGPQRQINTNFSLLGKSEVKFTIELFLVLPENVTIEELDNKKKFIESDIAKSLFDLIES